MSIDAVVFGCLAQILQDGRPIGNGLGLRPGSKGVAERKHVRIGADTGVAKQVPCAAHVRASFQDRVAFARALGLEVVAGADAGYSGTHNEDIELLDGHTRLLGGMDCRSLQHRQGPIILSTRNRAESSLTFFLICRPTMRSRLQFLCLLAFLQAGGAGALGKDLAVPPKSIAPGELGRRVNPFIGTGGVYYLSGNLFPGATTPFGMVRLSPDTVSSGGRRAQNTSGYYYRDERILGFSHTRLCGTGATDGGNFLVIPGVAGQMAKPPRQGMNAPFSHKNEAAFPGYYGVTFPELGIAAELTATRRVGVHRYTFEEGQAPRLVIHVSSVLGRGSSKEGQIRVIPEANEIEGSVRTLGSFAKRYGGLKTYFVARCNRRFVEHGAWTGDAFSRAQATAAGDDVAVDLTFEKSSAPSRSS